MLIVFDSARFKVKKKWLVTTAQSYLDQKGISPDLLINIIFVGRRKMLHIATTYKHDPVALPILCFPYITDKKMMFRTRAESVLQQAPGNVTENELSTINYQLSTTSPPLLGEIFICYPQAVLLAAEKNKRVDDMMTFLLHHAIDNLLLGREGTHHVR